MRMDRFSQYHPWVTFLYFLCLFTLTMCIYDPFFLLLSFLGALGYAKGWGTAQIPGYMLWMTGAVAVINPLFNHRGTSIVCYFMDNPITLESVFHGWTGGLLLLTVLVWFFSFQRVFTSDKIMEILGKTAPSLALVFSMTLGFVPRLSRQAQAIGQGRASLGKGSDGSLLHRCREGMTRLWALVTWGLESGVTTATSMKCRGYGTHVRTTFSNWKFRGGDWTAVGIILLLFGSTAVLWGMGGGMVSFFPTLSGRFSFLSAGAMCTFGVLCGLPMIINLLGEWQWKCLQSDS